MARDNGADTAGGSSSVSRGTEHVHVQGQGQGQGHG